MVCLFLGGGEGCWVKGNRMEPDVWRVRFRKKGRPCVAQFHSWWTPLFRVGARPGCGDSLNIPTATRVPMPMSTSNQQTLTARLDLSENRTNPQHALRFACGCPFNPSQKGCAPTIFSWEPEVLLGSWIGPFDDPFPEPSGSMVRKAGRRTLQRRAHLRSSSEDIYVGLFSAVSGQRRAEPLQVPCFAG